MAEKRIQQRTSLSEAALTFSEDGRTFEGYANRFGVKSQQGFTILAGAYEHTLRKHGKPKMFFGHDWGGLPIGKWTTVKEDEAGLFVRGEMTKGMQLSDEVYAAMKHGTLDGLSNGGFVASEDMEELEGDGGTVVKRFTRLLEISPVVFPDQHSARITLVQREALETLTDRLLEAQTLRQAEDALRDAGWSRSQAQAHLAHVKRLVLAEGEPPKEQLDMIERAFSERIGRITRSMLL